MPNEQTTHCVLCDKEFGIFRRKHHCRSCGALVCGKCSPAKMYVHGYKDQKVRVCQTCSNARQKRQREIEERGVFVSERNSGGYGKVTASTEIGE